MSTKPQPQRQPPDPLSQELLQAFDGVFGHHPGFRPVHAKGILLSGTFTPSASAQSLTNAPHITGSSTPVAVRFSDFAGIPNVPDFDEEGASPRGCAIRFYLADHVHTDIVAHSIDAFPVDNAEEFLEFLRAIAASGPGAAHPTPIEAFLSTHPAALAFVQAPKPIPTSFAHEHFFSVSAYKFTNASGAAQFARYRILPEEGTQYLDSASAKAQSPDFLFEELRNRIAAKPVRLHIKLQLAGQGDVVDNSTVQWPADRSVVEFGIVELTAILPENEAEQRRIIFDTIPRVQGIEPSGDPLLEPRANLYLHSGRRRRASA